MVTGHKKVLIADSDRKWSTQIKQKKESSQYHFDSVDNGIDCLKKIDSFQPDILIIELMLPHIHGIEILRKVKNDPRTKHIPVILTSFHPMLQNYHAALQHGVDYFLEKPCATGDLFQLLKLGIAGHLQPAPFTGKDSLAESKSHYQPKGHPVDTYIKFWGTRGSNPVSGPDYVRFGGNTCCLEVRYKKQLLIIDAGTGIRPLGTLLQEEGLKEIHILLSHTHWDHLAGFPFFQPIYQSDCHIHLWTPIGFEKTAKELFTEMLAYAYFPVRLDDIQAHLYFHEIQEGIPFDIGPFMINTHYAFHPGATLCFKITSPKTTFGYATDNEFLMGYHGNPRLIDKKNPQLLPYESQIQFFKGCDFLIHEAQYTPEEYQAKVGWGHSSIANVAVLVQQAKIPEWIITHHDPKHTDMDLLYKTQQQFDVLDDCDLSCRTRMAFDGLRLP